MRRRVLICIIVIVCVSAGCAISEKQEIEIGRQMHGQFEQEFGGLYPDSHVQQYVNAIGMEMVRYAGRPKLDWQFKVVNADQVNAFAVPGGYIYITQGLLFRLNNEAQLAGVLGHEAGHIVKRHSVKQLERARTAQGLTAVVGIAGAIFGIGGVGEVTGLVANLALMKYGRDQEREADYSGLGYMTSAGYNPAGMVQTMEILQTASGGGGGSPEFLSTHPNPGNRIEYLSDAIEGTYAPAAQTGTMGEARFQQNVLARRPAGVAALFMSVNVERPITWCATCQQDP